MFSYNHVFFGAEVKVLQSIHACDRQNFALGHPQDQRRRASGCQFFRIMFVLEEFFEEQ